jgi:hypothetical protein
VALAHPGSEYQHAPKRSTAHQPAPLQSNNTCEKELGIERQEKVIMNGYTRGELMSMQTYICSCTWGTFSKITKHGSACRMCCNVARPVVPLEPVDPDMQVDKMEQMA